MGKRNGGGDRDELFRSLYQKYYRRMVRYYTRVFRLSEEDAEELAQDAFIRFYQAMKDYRGDAEWAFFEAIARNLGYNRVRSLATGKRGAQTVTLDDPAVLKREPMAREEPDYAERQHETMRLERLRDEITKLPRRQRQCLQLRLNEQTYEEHATHLQITIDAVKSSVRDAKRLLRERMGDDGMLPEDDE
ncbi:MAG TPA: RNA polymerase sigma factor [Thermoanaerobaculia bacterium]|nr:RNA polymerase sigma factor [Thermoanaerobaculia bacterium]